MARRSTAYVDAFGYWLLRVAGCGLRVVQHFRSLSADIERSEISVYRNAENGG